MNDRFKFRYFYNGKLYDVFSIDSRQKNIDLKEDEMTLIHLGSEFNDKNLLQCTGLKDKNGKLIYEGDIVKDNQNSLYYVEFVEFEHQTKFCLKRIENPNYYPHISTWQGIGYKDQKNYEVIGNIYENKELLESEG